MRSKRMALAGIAVAAFSTAGGMMLHKDAPASYRTAPVQKGTIEAVVTSTGRLQATETVEVGTQVSGQVAQLLVDFNDHVKKGQLLARIDPTLLEAEVQSAHAGIERA